MKFIFQKAAKHYSRAHAASRRHIIKRPYILPLLGLVLGGIIVGAIWITNADKLALHPTNYHVVYLYDKGVRRTIDTNAKTVGELVASQHLNLIPQDVVEPSADTVIVQDNFRVNIHRARPVTIEDSGSKNVTLTAQQSPRTVVREANISIYPEDVASFQSGSLQNNVIGEEVVIARATPITLKLFGTDLSVRTQSKTVGELLKEKNVTLTSKDTLTPSIHTKITAGITVSIVRNGISTNTVELPIDPPIQYVDDSSLSFGATAVRQTGAPGKKAITYKIDVEHGREISRTILEETITVAPVPTIIARGVIVDIAGNKTAIMAAAGISSGSYGYVDYVISHESNWNPAARNYGGCLGLGQACPGSKLTAVCSLNDAVCQLRYFTGYANGRYGGWGGAYAFWTSHGYW